MPIKPVPRSTPIPTEVLAKMRSVVAGRARVLLDLLEKQEYVSTEQLKRLGYDQPPRVAMDAKEHGIPIVTVRVRDSKGYSIGAYAIGDPAKMREEMAGRKAFTKEFRTQMLVHYGSKSTITGAVWPGRALQIDHRIPFQVAGDPSDDKVEHYMLLDASQQRAKAFSCGECPNFKELKRADICRRCYWAYPENYDHVAMVARRQATIDWVGPEEVANYEKVKAAAAGAKQAVPAYIKAKLS